MKINLRGCRKGIKNGESRETSNIGYARRRKTKQKHNTCVRHHHTQTNTNNVNKTIALLSDGSFKL